MQSTLPEGYDFLQAPPPAKRNMLDGSSPRKRIVIVGGGLLILVILSTVVINIFQNANKPSTDLLISVLQDQQEVIRIAEIGSSKAKGSTALYYSTTVLATVRSDQKQLIDAQGKSFKVPAKTLAAKESKESTARLESAEQSNRLDETVVEVLEKQMDSYRKNLRAAHGGNVSKKSKDILEKAFTNTGYLVAKPETSK